MTRLTTEREKEIRDYWGTDPAYETGEWKKSQDLLAEIDALRAELDKAVTEFCRKVNALEKERDQLKAENERLHVFYDEHVGEVVESYGRSDATYVRALKNENETLEKQLLAANIQLDSDAAISHENENLRSRVAKLRDCAEFYAGRTNESEWDGCKFLTFDKFGCLLVEISGPYVANKALAQDDLYAGADKT